VLAPAALQQPEFDDDRRIVPHRARGYSYWYPWFSRQSSDTLRRVPEFDYSLNVGGGNMLSTAEDLVRFGSALLAPGLLTATSLHLLRTPIAARSSWSYGFIVASDSIAGTVLRITGSDPGYQASLSIYLDRRLVIALLQNSWGIRATPPPRFLDPVAQLWRMCTGTTAR
jgi:CubicO group peptidase (beta-lactamase class C family)